MPGTVKRTSGRMDSMASMSIDMSTMMGGLRFLSAVKKGRRCVTMLAGFATVR